MARSPHSLSGAHVLAWSSPLLLLVLLFTVTAHPTPSVPPATTPPTTTTSTSATTTTIPHHDELCAPEVDDDDRAEREAIRRRDRLEREVARARSRRERRERRAGRDPVTRIRRRRRPAARARGVEPDRSTSISAVLYCPSVSGPVVGEVVITSAEGCQLQVTSTNAQGLPQWQLTPVH